MGMTAKLHAVGSQLSGNMQNFLVINEFFLSAENRVGRFNEGFNEEFVYNLKILHVSAEL